MGKEEADKNKSNNIDSRGNRKRGHGYPAHAPSSPNKPPTKSFRSIARHVSFMDDRSASTSRVCFSSSTSSLTKGESSKHTSFRKSPAGLSKDDHEICQSESEISFKILEGSSVWIKTRGPGTPTDGATKWLNFRDAKRDSHHSEIYKCGVEGECKSDWSSRVIHSLSDVDIPNVSRSRVLLNYHPNGSIHLLGEGEYGYVVRGILKNAPMDKDIVAKYFKKDRSSLEDILDEARVLLYLQDTGYVPRVYGLIETNRKDCDPILIQECFGDGVTLDDLLDRKISKKIWLSICLQVASGLWKIHQKGVLINDIKLDNILVDYRGDFQHIRFIDMGIATFRSSYVSSGPEAAMAECSHLAPEVRKLKPSSPKSDIYGLGFVMTTIGRQAFIEELVALGNKLMSEKPNHRYSLPVTINRLNSLLRNA